METILTVGDFFQELRGGAQKLPPLPASAALNSPELPPFVEPGEAALVVLKQRLSFEAWLHLMRAQDWGVPYDHAQGERDIKDHFTRVIVLLAPGLGQVSLLDPVVRARLHWVNHHLLNGSLPKPYYELAAEAVLQQARRQGAMDALRTAMQGGAAHAPQPLPLVSVAARRKWAHSVYHPGFESWFVQELLGRSAVEMEAYLVVEWRVGLSGEAIQPGDARQTITPEELPYLCDLLKSTAAANPSAKLALKRARSWFMQYAETSLSADVTEVPMQPSPELSLRQIALLELYQGRPIRNDARARKLAQEHGHDSPSSALVLARRYRNLQHETNIIGVDGKALEPMIADLLVVQNIVGKGKNFKLDNHIFTLERKK